MAAAKAKKSKQSDFHFDPPAFMDDFDGIPGQRDQWHAFVSGTMDEAISGEEQSVGAGKCQFYNPARTTPDGDPVQQRIVWSAFPKTLLGKFGSPAAYAEAEQLALRFPGALWPGASLYQHRQHDEYCEWRTYRLEGSQKVSHVIFTSEPPEYWHALAGDTLPNGNNDPTYAFTGDTAKLLALYRSLVSPDVQLADLFFDRDIADPASDATHPLFRAGHYNPYNKWNTTHGIVHLTHPSNYLSAEIQLGADATILRKGPDGRLVTRADELICCAGYGGASRTSDPTIGASVNTLARAKFHITLANPVGLYMMGINLAGFSTPDGSPVDETYWQVLRGNKEKRMIERAVFRVPEDKPFVVGDLRIGAVPITSGGQVADHIMVGLIGEAVGQVRFEPTPLPCSTFCYITTNAPNLPVVAGRRAVPPDARRLFGAGEGEVPAFDGGREMTTAATRS